MSDKLMGVREAYGETLARLGEIYKDIVVLDADLSDSTRTCIFAKKFPERFFNMGISEQDLMGTAAGLAAAGKIPFVSTFAIFATGRPWEQIRQSIAYSSLNVKIVASHGGITVGDDGGSHQAIEDIALMRHLPNMVVIVPTDAIEMKSIIETIVEYNGPVYVRGSRIKFPIIFDDNYKFEIGKGHVLLKGSDVTIVAAGYMVHSSLEAAKGLAQEGIHVEVISMPTIKPLDEILLLKSAAKTNAVVTVEEHLITGGLGSAVSEVLSENYPTTLKRIGIKDKFGISGKPKQLLSHFGLTPHNIVEAVKEVLRKKKKRVHLQVVATG